MRFVIGFWALLLLASPVLAQPTESFESFVKNFEREVVAAGVSAQTYRQAVAGIKEDTSIPSLVSGQPEFTTPMWDYIDQRVSQGRIGRGQAAVKANAGLFQAVGERTGVDPYILAAIWGMETDYGAVLDNRKMIKPILPALMTLVHQKRTRYEEDKADLIAAFKLIERGPRDAKTLIGSWAGAIGHLQVNPSNVIAHGSDGDGDGVVDLHGSLADALATSAKFLRDLGYLPGMDWGFEVELPAGFDYLLADRETYRPIAFFAERGVTRVGGRAFARTDIPVFLYVPAGANGPKFLMTPNYLVLKGYNFSDSYAMSVAHMADRLKGSGTFVTPWPRNTKFPNLEQRKGVQAALMQLGFYDGVVDGRLGPISQAAYAKFQAQKGEVADGFITLRSYEELAAAVR